MHQPRRATATLGFPECTLRFRAIYRRFADHHIRPSFIQSGDGHGDNMSGTGLIEIEIPHRRIGGDVPSLVRNTWLSPRRLLLVTAMLPICAVSVGYGWHYWTTGRFEVSTDDAYVKADSTIIAPKVSGYLRDVLVSDNQWVTPGQILARIDDRDYAVALAQAQADVAASKGEIGNIEATIARQKAVIEQAAGTVAIDEAALVFAERDYTRSSNLASRGVGTVQMADRATSKRDAARAALARDKAALMAETRQTDVLRAQLSQSTATLARREAVEQKANLDLGYTTVIAPVGGVVGNRTLRVGQLVQAGTALMAVVPIRRTYIVANFKETQLTDIRSGQPVTLHVDSLPGVQIMGHVDSIAPASGQEFALLPPDNATGNFT